MKAIITFIFGQRAQGETLPPPRLRTTYPTHTPEENEWRKEVKFGNRYGHRGSFYEAR